MINGQNKDTDAVECSRRDKQVYNKMKTFWSSIVYQQFIVPLKVMVLSFR